MGNKKRKMSSMRRRREESPSAREIQRETPRRRQRPEAEIGRKQEQYRMGESGKNPTARNHSSAKQKQRFHKNAKKAKKTQLDSENSARHLNTKSGKLQEERRRHHRRQRKIKNQTKAPLVNLDAPSKEGKLAAPEEIIPGEEEEPETIAPGPIGVANPEYVTVPYSRAKHTTSEKKRSHSKSTIYRAIEKPPDTENHLRP